MTLFENGGGERRRPLETLTVIWGVPGAGKSTFCRWLAKTHGFTYAETDARASVEQAVVQAQQGDLVVIEYGMWVERGSTGQIRAWRSLGAQAWWFAGDRVAAFQAWKQENARQGRPFADDLWHRVVGEVDATGRSSSNALPPIASSLLMLSGPTGEPAAGYYPLRHLLDQTLY